MLAGRRSGNDPLAEAAGAPHRALLDIEDEPMLLRVVRRLLGRDGLERVIVNIDAPELVEALPGWAEHAADPRVTVLRSTDSPSRSVLESLDAAKLDFGPVLVTTADHALLDDAMLDAFLAGCPRMPTSASPSSPAQRSSPASPKRSGPTSPSVTSAIPARTCSSSAPPRAARPPRSGSGSKQSESNRGSSPAPSASRTSRSSSHAD